jgi:hypothetical protein
MRLVRQSALLTAVLAAAVLSTACAGAVVYRSPAPSPRINDYAYRVGLRDGRAHGARDATERRSFDYARHEEYRRATRGGRDWDDGAAYRRGFAEGYDEAYREVAVAERWRGGTRERDARDGYATRGSVAGIHGYRDGYDQGRDDAHDGDRYDPVRARRYRQGDNGYERSVMSRDEYKRQYRRAFVEGYEDGYRDGQRRR